MNLINQKYQETIAALDVATCLSIQDGQQECWQNLFCEFTARLTTTEVELQKALADIQRIEAERKQLEEKLGENQAKHQALTEASTAQARQFSETLKQLHLNQAQIVQAEKMSSLGQLVAGVAHEINNPINFIYGNISCATEYIQDLMHLLSLYQKHYPQPASEIQEEANAIDLDFLSQDLPNLLASMKVGADRIQNIVLSLRNFSRMDEAEVKAVDIHEGIDNTLMILQNRLKEKSDRPGIKIIKNYGKLPLIECYAGQLNQVFMNLLANAIDALEERYKSFKADDLATRIVAEESEKKEQKAKDLETIIENGSLEEKSGITSKKQNSWTPVIEIQTQMLGPKRLSIRIADNGLGIPESVKQHLFDPFFTTKPIGKGTGLGLSISYQIIADKHGGDLKCISSVGQGAEFIIEIPT